MRIVAALLLIHIPCNAQIVDRNNPTILKLYDFPTGSAAIAPVKKFDPEQFMDSYERIEETLESRTEQAISEVQATDNELQWLAETLIESAGAGLRQDWSLAKLAADFHNRNANGPLSLDSATVRWRGFNEWLGDTLAEYSDPQDAAKAMQRIGIAVTTAESKPYVKVVAPREAADVDDGRLDIRYYCMPDGKPCRYCEMFAADRPGMESWANFDDRDPPDWVESFPTFHWQSEDGSWVQFKGWDRDDFIRAIRTENPKFASENLNTAAPRLASSDGRSETPVRRSQSVVIRPAAYTRQAYQQPVYQQPVRITQPQSSSGIFRRVFRSRCRSCGR